MANLSLIHFLTIILRFTSSMQITGKPLAPAAKRFLPANNGTEYRKMEAAEAEAEGDPFELCSDCRCCAQDDPTNCSQMPCCYSIDCDLPDKPYGVCAFVPNSCDCTDCA